MPSSLVPPAQSRDDRKAGAMLIAFGLINGFALGGIVFDNTGIGVLMGVALGLTLYLVGMCRS